MKHIEGYLGNKNLTPVLDIKNECVDLVLKHTGVVVSTKVVSFSGKTIFLKTTPNEKIKILLNKKKLINAFKDSKKLTFYNDVL